MIGFLEEAAQLFGASVRPRLSIRQGSCVRWCYSSAIEASNLTTLFRPVFLAEYSA